MAEAEIVRHMLNVLHALHHHGVKFVLIGGLAMRLHGSAHVTDDLDIFYGRDDLNLELLVQTLAPLHPTLHNAPKDLPFIFDARTLKMGANFTFDTDEGRVDLLSDVGEGLQFEQIWQRADEMEVDGIPVRVVSLDDLIALKRAASRPKDLLHIMELEAIKKLRETEG